MDVKVTIKDYTTMSIKQLEKEHQNECCKLLKLINDGSSKEKIELQKKQTDLVYNQLCIHYRKVAKLRG